MESALTVGVEEKSADSVPSVKRSSVVRLVKDAEPELSIAMEPVRAPERSEVSISPLMA